MNMQQATVNLFADMGVQPVTLQSGLSLATKSTDTTPPSSTITSPTGGTTAQAGAIINVTGTASDSGGGLVAGVEVSVDSGVTWHPATGLNSWSYTWTANKAGTFSVLSRAVDDSGNIETPSLGSSVNILGVTSLTLSPNSLNGGASSQATVTLSAPAAAGGTVVTLSSSNTAVANVPVSVTIPAGSSSANFTVTTNPVGATTTVAISATYASTVSATLTVNTVFPPPPGFLAFDTSVAKDQSTSGTTLTSPTFSTLAANELVLAMISSDAIQPGMTVSSVTGAGLTWTLAVRTNAQGGTAEIWKAFAPSALTNVSVTATFSQSSPSSSITITTFAGVDASNNGASAVGATASASSAKAAPSASLTTTRSGSWVLGVGTDYDNAIARTAGTNQTSDASVAVVHWRHILGSTPEFHDSDQRHERDDQRHGSDNRQFQFSNPGSKASTGRQFQYLRYDHHPLAQVPEQRSRCLVPWDSPSLPIVMATTGFTRSTWRLLHSNSVTEIVGFLTHVSGRHNIFFERHGR